MEAGECAPFVSHVYNVTDSAQRHIEGHSTVFGTGLNYTALRILGVSAEHPVMIKARGTLHALGSSNLSLILRAGTH